MRKILGAILEVLGFSKADAETVIGLLAAHLTLEVVLTVVVLILTIAVPVLVSRPLADRFDRRAKARDRQERVDDIALAAYHEIFIAWMAMIEAFGAPGAAEAIVKRMEEDASYFPIYTFDPSAPAVYENYVKTDIAIFPTELIRATIAYYQSSYFFLAYLTDSRNERVVALQTPRKIAFVRTLHSSAFEHLAIACDALIAYEGYVDGLRRKKRRRRWSMTFMWWEWEQPDLLLSLEPLTKSQMFSAVMPAVPEPYTLGQRRQIYRNLESSLKNLVKTTADGVILAIKPAGESAAGT